MIFEFILTYISLPLISLSVFMIFIRVAKGPSIADRIIALDLLTAVGIGFIAVYSMVTNHTTILDVAIILALLAFLGTVAFAYYVERRRG